MSNLKQILTQLFLVKQNKIDNIVQKERIKTTKALKPDTQNQWKKTSIR